MSFFGKIKKRILNCSDTYNYYKNEHDVHTKKIKKLEKNLKKLEKSTKKINKEHDAILDSYNTLFNILYIDHEIKAKGVLKDIHDLCQELLNFIVNVCEKYDLEYWLDYGTLIGAARHEGFIPWDDDIDLGMMRKDYERFLDIIEDELKFYGLDETIEVFSYQYDGKYIAMFIQLKMSHINTTGLYAGLDVFCYDFIKNPDENTTKKFKELQTQFRKKLINGIELDEVLQEYFDELNITYERQDHIIPAIEGARGPSSIYDFDILKTESIFPLTQLKFNDQYYSCPNKYDSYLKSIYGDYTTIHKVLRVHTRLKYLKVKDNIRNNFAELNNMLKEANNSFE